MNEKLNTIVKILIGESLSIDDLNVLSLLYMPIIGNRAYALYMTMYSALNRSSNTRVVKLSDMTDLFGITINTLSLDRKRLEAIGLMNTFSKDDELVFLLKAPLSARQFFNDCILSISLKNKVGDELFYKLVNLFKVESFNREGYKNITEVYENVFKNKIEDEKINLDGYLIDKNKNSSVKTGEYSFDYDYFVSLLNLGLLEKNNLSAEFQKTVERIAYLYNLKEEDMQVLYYRALDQNGNFSITKLQREAKLFNKRNEIKQAPIDVIGIERLRSMDPKSILKICVADASEADYDTIDKLIEITPFSIDITNMIVFQSLTKNNMKCPDLGYFQKVIDTFMQFKIKTFEDATKFVLRQSDPSNKQANIKEENSEPGGSKWLDEFNKKFK